MRQRWQFWIDVGGTFTDCIGVRPDGDRIVTKVLSSGKVLGRAERTDSGGIFANELKGQTAGFWKGATIRLDGQDFICTSSSTEGNLELESQGLDGQGFDSKLDGQELDGQVPSKNQALVVDSHQPAPLLAIHKLLDIPLTQSLPDLEIKLGTTRGTNALLTRSGARVALVTTAGFKDLLRIGFQNRPDIFAIDIVKPEPLFETAIEIEERILHDGTIETEPDESEVRRKLLKLKQAGIESLAICFLHAFRFPDHEQRVAAIARDVGFNEISISSSVAPEIRVVPRAYTTVLDAYLNPVLREYIGSIREQLSDDSKLTLFSSAGALVPADRFTGKDSILSGPAGGVVGFSQTANDAGITKAIGFDMGGTSTDVSRFDGVFHYQYESQKSGVFIVAPTLSIETVAAGGGSICQFDGTRFTVGPDSAGANPGPACYGNGGPLCLTDVNLFLGRIHAETFPFPLDPSAVQTKLESIQHQYVAATGEAISLEKIAEGFLAIAVAKTAQAIRLVSLQKGYDVTEYALVSFGGAAGQICCRVAEMLCIEKILIHPNAGILSAYGIGKSERSVHQTHPVYQPLLSFSDEQFAKTSHDLQMACLSELDDEDLSSATVNFRSSVDVRYQGTDSYLSIDFNQFAEIPEQFQLAHQKRFGFTQEHPIEVGAMRMEARVVSRPETAPPMQKKLSTSNIPGGPEPIDRLHLRSGDQVSGPRVVYDPLSTTVIDRNWKTTVLPDQQLLLQFDSDAANGNAVSDSAANRAVQIELLNNQLFSIAEQMGEILRGTAVSVNVKERLDFSCAIFTATGDLIANAPHIPIHLGAMSECVKLIIADNAQLAPGDVFLTNDPYRGGSHLPDLTVVTPCFDAVGELRFWVASRAHHAEMGGTVPGSMPPDSRTLEEEGVLIQNFRVLTKTGDRFSELREILTSARYPSRQPDTNIADIQAQIAANQNGISELMQLLDSNSENTLNDCLAGIRALAASETTRVIRELDRDEYTFTDFMDCGAKISVSIRRTGDQLTVDFSGTSPVLENNLNANPAIVMSALIYVLRLRIGKNIPLNQGILDPVQLILPECFLNPASHSDPAKCPAVVGGNVETSQRVVDVLMGALEMAAASQGTSNNVVFGDESFGYYETICGGSGATANQPGADAVQVHITNTRITDPEILETRYPVVLEEFSIRENSGGDGLHRGGNGVVRRMRFTRPLTLSVLRNRYAEFRPYGLDGGQPGAAGEFEAFESGESDSANVIGFQIKTPGGGGWGEVES